jgi:transposase
MILSCSRALFVQPVLKMDQGSWNASHVAAFEFFGGVPTRLVLYYVARHIIGVLCPTVFCGRSR